MLGFFIREVLVLGSKGERHLRPRARRQQHNIIYLVNLVIKVLSFITRVKIQSQRKFTRRQRQSCKQKKKNYMYHNTHEQTFGGSVCI